MHLLGSTRAADAAIWRRSDLGRYTGGLRRVAPVLAVEVTGEDESESELQEKARWYLKAGVAVVWIVVPEDRAVVVIDGTAQTRYTSGQLPARPALPALSPQVSEFFSQVESR